MDTLRITWNILDLKKEIDVCAQVCEKIREVCANYVHEGCAQGRGKYRQKILKN